MTITNDTAIPAPTPIDTRPQSNSAATLTPTDLAVFARLGIGPELLAEAGVRRVSDAEARSDYGIRFGAAADLSGVVFPYFSHITGRRVTARVRRDNPEVDADGRPQGKYISPYGDGRHLYFPPGAKEKLADPSTPVCLVESEKAVLSLTAWTQRTNTNLIPIGTGGCNGWSGRNGIETTTKGEREEVRGPLPDLDYCNDRKVFVLLDSNAATNEKVAAARTALCAELRTRKCDVLICELPILNCINGPDDFLGVCGDVAMAEIFAAAHAHEGWNRASNRTEAEAPAARRGYLRMPHSVLQHGPALGPYGLAVALVLADHADSQGVCWPSIRRIMKTSGIGAPSTVQKALEKLCELSVIETEKKRHGFITKHLYRFTGWNGESVSPNSSDESAPFHPMKLNKNHRTRTNSPRGKKFVPSASSDQQHQVQSPVDIELPISPHGTVNEFIEGEL